MKYLRVFDSNESYNKEKNNLPNPSVSLINETKETISYNPVVITAKYTKNTQRTELIRNTKDVLYMEVDGVEVTPSEYYWFDDLLTHTVKFILKDNFIFSGAFEGLQSLISIDIPYGVIHIGERAFNNCFNLEVINIPSSIQIISNKAFMGCDKLKLVYLPESIKEIGNNAFSSCCNLSTIVCKCNIAPSTYMNSFGDGTSFKNQLGYETLRYTGRNTYSLGVNRLYLPSNYSNYEGNAWSELLDENKCGFSIITDEYYYDK